MSERMFFLSVFLMTNCTTLTTLSCPIVFIGPKYPMILTLPSYPSHILFPLKIFTSLDLSRDLILRIKSLHSLPPIYDCFAKNQSFGTQKHQHYYEGTTIAAEAAESFRKQYYKVTFIPTLGALEYVALGARPSTLNVPTLQRRACQTSPACETCESCYNLLPENT